MRLTIFENVTNTEKAAAVDNLIVQSTPRQDFFLLVLLSVFMATIGLLQNNVATIIGSMLIAPVLYPILGVSMGIVMANGKLVSRSFKTILQSVALGILAAALVTLLKYPPGGEAAFQTTPEIVLRIHPSLADSAIAFFAGLAAALALVKPKLSETLPGIAISVALVPPLSTVGVGLAAADFYIASRAGMLFFINIVGIMLAAVMVFSAMNFYVQRSEAKEVIKEEDKKLEEEKKAPDEDENDDTNASANKKNSPRNNP